MGERDIIRIDEALCDGCGNCITTCAEGALELVDGKARLVKDLFCDGFGDCIRDCPTGALVIEQREAPEFDFEATREHVRNRGGEEAVQRLEAAAMEHESQHGSQHEPAPAAPAPGGCPGARLRHPAMDGAAEPADVQAPGAPSALRQWPVQIHLVQPGMPFFRDKELVVMNTCGPLAAGDVHPRFLAGRSVVVGCPKLDDTGPYVNKLAAILAEPSIPKVVVVRMEVPCCGGLSMIVRQAAERTGRADLAFEEVVLGVGGQVLS